MSFPLHKWNEKTQRFCTIFTANNHTFWQIVLRITLWMDKFCPPVRQNVHQISRELHHVTLTRFKSSIILCHSFTTAAVKHRCCDASAHTCRFHQPTPPLLLVVGAHQGPAESWFCFLSQDCWRSALGRTHVRASQPMNHATTWRLWHDVMDHSPQPANLKVQSCTFTSTSRSGSCTSVSRDATSHWRVMSL